MKSAGRKLDRILRGPVLLVLLSKVQRGPLQPSRPIPWSPFIFALPPIISYCCDCDSTTPCRETSETVFSYRSLSTYWSLWTVEGTGVV